MNTGTGQLVIYIAEKTTTVKGTPYTDFAAFVRRQGGRYNGRYVLDFTRNPDRVLGNKADNEMPTGQIVFESVDQVLEFLRNVLGEPCNLITVELHMVDVGITKRHAHSKFFDLWGSTGKRTEITAVDELMSLKEVSNALFQLDSVHRIEILED